MYYYIDLQRTTENKTKRNINLDVQLDILETDLMAKVLNYETAKETGKITVRYYGKKEDLIELIERYAEENEDVEVDMDTLLRSIKKV